MVPSRSPLRIWLDPDTRANVCPSACRRLGLACKSRTPPPISVAEYYRGCFFAQVFPSGTTRMSSVFRRCAPRMRSTIENPAQRFASIARRPGATVGKFEAAAQGETLPTLPTVPRWLLEHRGYLPENNKGAVWRFGYLSPEECGCGCDFAVRG